MKHNLHGERLDGAIPRRDDDRPVDGRSERFSVTVAFSLNNVSVAFTTPEGIKPVLIDINLQITRGDWVAVIGRNGSGKSTLSLVLARLCPISRGKITYESGNAQQQSTQLIFQNPDAQIVGETVYEDICFGLENKAIPPADFSTRVHAALTQVGLEDFHHRRVEHLSGGQKQLLCIAAALAMDAAVLIFDEATSMLDPLSRQRVVLTAKKLHEQGKTIIWVTQFMEELGYANRVIALDAGQIAFDGNPSQFFYGTDDNQVAPPYTRLSFIAPYIVQVTQQLLQAGVNLSHLPLLPIQLDHIVRDLCRSR